VAGEEGVADGRWNGREEEDGMIVEEEGHVWLMARDPCCWQDERRPVRSTQVGI
jgi:hypothetical protein